MEVEAVFGQLKSNKHFKRFTMKGLEKVKLEFLWMAIGHNLRKMGTKSRQLAQQARVQAEKTSFCLFPLKMATLSSKCCVLDKKEKLK